MWKKPFAPAWHPCPTVFPAVISSGKRTCQSLKILPGHHLPMLQRLYPRSFRPSSTTCRTSLQGSEAAQRICLLVIDSITTPSHPAPFLFCCQALSCSRQDQGKSLLKGTRHFNQDIPPIFNGRVWKQGGSTRGKFEGEGVRSPLSTTRHAKQCGCEESSYPISLKEQCCKTSFFHKRHTTGHALRCQLAPDLMGV